MLYVLNNQTNEESNCDKLVSCQILRHVLLRIVELQAFYYKLHSYKQHQADTGIKLGKS